MCIFQVPYMRVHPTSNWVQSSGVWNRNGNHANSHLNYCCIWWTSYRINDKVLVDLKNWKCVHIKWLNLTDNTAQHIFALFFPVLVDMVFFLKSFKRTCWFMFSCLKNKVYNILHISVGWFIHCKACLTDYWKNSFGPTDLKLGRKVSHNQETTSLDINVKVQGHGDFKHKKACPINN